MISTAGFYKGLKIEVDGEPYIIIDFQHVKLGRGGAFVRTRLKSLLTQRVMEKVFRSGEKVGRPDLDQRQMQFLYRDGDFYHFMDERSYEEITLTSDQVGEARNFLTENISISALFYKGKAVGIELPTFVELEVVDTEPGVRGDTVSGGSKPATLSTGAVVQVPLFINTGDRITVDTRTGDYIERVK